MNPVGSVRLSFFELRAMVIAIFRYGESIKGLTFSEGNAGNDYKDLARILDRLVVDLNKDESVLLMGGKALKETEDKLARLQEVLQSLQESTDSYSKFVGELEFALGTDGQQMERHQIVQEVHRLVGIEENHQALLADLEAKKAKKRGKKCTTRK